MNFRDIDMLIARYLPGDHLKEWYTRGMRRLAEYGLLRGTYESQTKFGFSMHVDRLDIVKWYVFYFGWLEPQISQAWFNLLQDGDHVLDIGGNVGYHAMLAATRIGHDGKVTTFEPSKKIADQMRKNIELNGFRNVELVQKAVLDRRDEVRLYFGGESAQGSTSTVEGHPTDAHSPIFETVEAITFDDVMALVEISKLRVIKIDVEGAEEEVLAGLQRHANMLPKDVVIFVEISAVNAAEGMKWLQPFLDSGFEARLIENRYTVRFLREPGGVCFSPLRLQAGMIHDVVLTRNPTNYDTMMRGR